MKVLVIAVLLLGVPTEAIAQPWLWGVSRFLFSTLSVTNAATGEEELRLNAPPGITFVGGALSPDGQTYWLVTSAGIARFDAIARELVGVVGEPIDGGQVWLSPDGRFLHASHTFVNGFTSRYRIVELPSGATVHDECCGVINAVAFGSGGATYLARSVNGIARISAHSGLPTGAAQWTVESNASSGANIFVLPAGDEVVVARSAGSGYEFAVLDAATGAVKRSTSLDALRPGLPEMGTRLLGLTVKDGALYATIAGSYFLGQPTVYDRLIRIDGQTFAATSIGEAVPLPQGRTVGATIGAKAAFSFDGSRLYWMRFAAAGGPMMVFDASDFRVLALSVRSAGVIPSGSVDITSHTPCTFTLGVGPSIQFPAGGGVAEMPVVATGPCAPWLVYESGFPEFPVLNPGRRTGSDIVQIAATPNNRFTSERTGGYTIAGHSVSIRQAAETSAPGTPLLRVERLDDRRVEFRWTPGPDPDPVDFRIRGGVRGQPQTTVVAVAGDVRTWTSAPLAPGSYSFAVLAVNSAGSTSSNVVDLSIDVSDTPQPPTNLTATVGDDVVALRWRPSPIGTAPASYTIEAAPGTSSTFMAVTSTTDTALRAVSVPPGTWQVRVRARTAGGTSEPSNVVMIATSRCMAAPVAPGNLSAQVNGTRVTLQWTASAAAESYALEAGLSRGSSSLGQFALGPEPVFETTAPRGVYFVRVRARNGCGQSSPSNEAIVVVP